MPFRFGQLTVVEVGLEDRLKSSRIDRLTAPYTGMNMEMAGFVDTYDSDAAPLFDVVHGPTKGLVACLT
jgi:hypothetical protein